jgi:CheY-like chemotaxis protein
MVMKIAVLEDNAERTAEMRRYLSDRFYQYDLRFFDDASEMKAFLEKNLPETLLICLDHDLELKQLPSGEVIDPGTGRDIVDFLSDKPPVCPVVIHTTNTAAADGMESVLNESHWRTFRVSPFNDLEWIPTDWFRTVRRAIVRP